MSSRVAIHITLNYHELQIQIKSLPMVEEGTMMTCGPGSPSSSRWARNDIVCTVLPRPQTKPKDIQACQHQKLQLSMSVIKHLQHPKQENHIHTSASAYPVEDTERQTHRNSQILQMLIYLKVVTDLHFAPSINKQLLTNQPLSKM